MSNKETFIWSGKTKWAKLQRPEEAFGKEFYSMNFYPESDKIRKEIAKNLPRNKLYEDEDGFFFKLRAPAADKPKVVLAEDGEEFDGLIGNNSDVSVKVQVEKFTSKKHGDVTRATLKGVRIDELIEYDPDPDVDDDDDDDAAGENDLDDDIPF